MVVTETKSVKNIYGKLTLPNNLLMEYWNVNIALFVTSVHLLPSNVGTLPWVAVAMVATATRDRRTGTDATLLHSMKI